MPVRCQCVYEVVAAARRVVLPFLVVSTYQRVPVVNLWAQIAPEQRLWTESAPEQFLSECRLTWLPFGQLVGYPPVRLHTREPASHASAFEASST